MPGRDPLLCGRWKPGIDTTGWFMSEKFEGMRAYWDGKSFFSMQYQKIPAPEFFKKTFPSSCLDGVLWCGYKNFPKCVGIVTLEDGYREEDWKELQYWVFDAPKETGPLSTRYTCLLKWFEKPHPFIRILTQQICQGEIHMEQELKKIALKQGRGLILRDPASQYGNKEHGTMYKVNVSFDVDAMVVKIEKDQRTGRMYRLHGKLQQGNNAFTVATGFSEADRYNPPQVGTLITIRHEGWRNMGHPHPRHPIFLLRVKPDQGEKEVTKSGDTIREAASISIEKESHASTF